ncbi:MAG: alpha/beta hydrolase [Myxococcales bacterium]|nr:alpha/beta hydrolase [Myxococcales bacterium]
MSTISEPRTHRIDSRGLAIEVYEWGDGPDTVILHHGFLDHGRSWDPVAQSLSERFHVLAVDARGHGSSGWIGDGGYYYFQDYLPDLRRVIDALARGRVSLVGHSMGGMVVTLFAGTFTNHVHKLITIEGYGPPDNDFDAAPRRVTDWVSAMVRFTGERKVMATVEEAAARMRRRNSRLSEEFSLHLAEHGTHPIEGGVTWAWDPLHRLTGPQPFYLAQAQAIWAKISCPALSIRGAESNFNIPGLVERENFSPEIVVIPDAGHMVHHDQPRLLSEAISNFLGRSA